MWLIKCQTHTQVSPHTVQDTFFLKVPIKKNEFVTNGFVLFAK